VIRRPHPLDIEAIARDLIADVRGNTGSFQIGDGVPFGDDGDLDAVGTFGAYEDSQRRAGDEITADDYQTLAIHLAKMCVGQVPIPDVGEA
jgi:hypothetical protein